MTTTEKLEKLNEVCKKSISITYFATGWEIYSYEDDTPLNIAIKHPKLKDDSIEALIDKAYKFVFKGKK